MQLLKWHSLYLFKDVILELTLLSSHSLYLFKDVIILELTLLSLESLTLLFKDVIILERDPKCLDSTSKGVNSLRQTQGEGNTNADGI